MNNIKEYLDFLELSSNANHVTILERIDEKQKLFSQLLHNAPNEYLKNIHTKNISKLTEISSFFNKGFVAAKEINNIEKTKNNGSNSSIAWLIRHTENMQPKSFPLFVGDNFIGRANNKNSNQITIDDDIYISRNHAIILVENGKYKITDMDSKNGTYINGLEKKNSLSNLKKRLSAKK